MPRGSQPGERRGGRQKGTLNKVTRDVRALAVEYGPDCIAALVEIGLDQERRSANEATRIAAIKELLDRAYGKPGQAVEIAGEIGGGFKLDLSDPSGGTFSGWRHLGGATSCHIALSANSCFSK